MFIERFKKEILSYTRFCRLAMRQNFVLEDENLYVFNSNYNKVISNCSGMKSHHGIWVLMNHYRTSTNQVFKKKKLNSVIPDLNRLLVKSKKRHKAKPSKDFFVESCCWFNRLQIWKENIMWYYIISYLSESCSRDEHPLAVFTTLQWPLQ